MKNRVPLRKCIGCVEMKSKSDLIRVVKNKDGEINIDLTGKMPGRGAYICKDAECLKKAQKKRQLERAFQMSIEPCIYEKLFEQLGDADERK